MIGIKPVLNIWTYWHLVQWMSDINQKAHAAIGFMLSAVFSALPIYWYLTVIKKEISAASVTISIIGLGIACIEFCLMIPTTIVAVVNYRKDQ